MISLSFDTDHIDDARMREFLDTVRIPGQGTFFCTQRYEALGEPHELGPHVRLEAGAKWEAELDAGREMFPDAVGFRAHGCVAGHWLSARVASRGYTYISSQDIFGTPSPGPFREAWGVWHVPIYYMETLDLAFAENWPDEPPHRPFSDELIDRAIGSDELCVFVFHPIHLLLNSESVEGYVARRKELLAGASSDEARHRGTGARTFYDRLVDEMEAAEISSVTLAEVVRQAAGSPTPSAG